MPSKTAKALENTWKTSPRWRGINRDYTAEDVLRLRGRFQESFSLAMHGASRLWELFESEDYVHVLSAVTGNQAVQEVSAGLKAIYISGWQVAADMNAANQTYPDQSLYPSDSVPELVDRINQALLRADEIHHLREEDDIDWVVPLVADAEAGFGGPLHAFEIMKGMIRKGAAGVHFEDQLASVKKCGHLGGKVLVPTKEFVVKLNAARLAADVAGVPTVLIARTDAFSSKLLTNDFDEADHPFMTGERSPEGHYYIKQGLETAIARGLAYAPYADLLWMETSTPDLNDAQKFADAVHARYPDKPLAYNCSPSFNWKRNLSDDEIAVFQQELGAMGYKFQFVTLSGFHSLNHAMYNLACDYRDRGMAAYTGLQEAEFAAEKDGYQAVRHQEFVGVGYFDEVTKVASGGKSATTAMDGSTEADQFDAA